MFLCCHDAKSIVNSVQSLFQLVIITVLPTQQRLQVFLLTKENRFCSVTVCLCLRSASIGISWRCLATRCCWEPLIRRRPVYSETLPRENNTRNELDCCVVHIHQGSSKRHWAEIRFRQDLAWRLDRERYADWWSSTGASQHCDDIADWLPILFVVKSILISARCVPVTSRSDWWVVCIAATNDRGFLCRHRPSAPV